MIRVDVSLWPLTVTTIEGAISLADASILADAHRDILARREKHVNLFDGTLADTLPDAVVRKKLAELTAHTGEASKRWAVGSAFVVTNAIVRGSITAIHWVSPPTIPTRVVATYDEGLAWCIGRLSAGGIALGTALEAHVAQRGVSSTP